MERVSVLYGKNPVILVAPHGFDDSNTDIMTEAAAKQANCNAVINRGWERDAQVDVLKDKANCNNWKHCQHDVVKDEFFDPIIKMESRLLARHSKIYVFHIHGCGNDIRKKTGKNLGVVIGWGKGEKGKSRPTCDRSTRDLFSYIIEKDGMWLPGQADAGSKFAGWDTNNLLQMWKSSVPMVAAMQLEFVTNTRKSKSDAIASGNYLGDMIKKFVTQDKAMMPVPTSYSCYNVTF